MRRIGMVLLVTTVLLANCDPALARGRRPKTGLPSPRVRVSQPEETCYQLVDRAWPGASFRLLKDESDPLGDPDERNTPQGVGSIPAVPRHVALGMDQTVGFVEPERRRGNACARGQFADREPLDFNHG